MNYIIT